MIDPASTGDWMVALLMAAALGALSVAGTWALRQEHLDRDTLPPVLTREVSGPVGSAAARPPVNARPSA